MLTYSRSTIGANVWAQSPAEIGKIIATGRRHHKLSQAALAKLLGTTQAWISEIEKGKETAQIGLVLRALRRLGVRLRTADAPWETRPDAARTRPDGAHRGPRAATDVVPRKARRSGHDAVSRPPSLADVLAKTSEVSRARAARSRGSR